MLSSPSCCLPSCAQLRVGPAHARAEHVSPSSREDDAGIGPLGDALADGVVGRIEEPADVVRSVAGFEELQGAERGVGRERLVAPPVGLFEEGELGAGVGSFAARSSSSGSPGCRVAGSNRRPNRAWAWSSTGTICASMRSCRIRIRSRGRSGMWTVRWRIGSPDWFGDRYPEARAIRTLHFGG